MEEKFNANNVIVNTRQMFDRITQDFIALAKSCEYLEKELEKTKKEIEQLKSKED